MKNWTNHFNQRIQEKDIAILLRQFATLISAGIPIVKSCDILEKSQEKLALKKMIYQIKQQISAGKSLSSALKSHQHFNELTRHLILIGEQTGKLDDMLLMIAEHHEKQLAFKKQLQQILFYPIFIFICALIMTFGMLIFVIPHFVDLFHDMNNKLPLLTQCIFYLSNALRQSLVLIIFLFGLMMGVIYFKWDSLKKYSFKHLHKLPGIKSFLQKILLTRFARNLAITLSAGIPITEALSLTSNTFHLTNFSTTILKLRSQICSGKQLYQAMELSHAFPLIMVQMIKIGEESGTLEQMLVKLADFFESETNQLVGHFSKLLEPLIMVVLGALIGGLVIGMYLPIFKLGNSL